MLYIQQVENNKSMSRNKDYRLISFRKVQGKSIFGN